MAKKLLIVILGIALISVAFSCGGGSSGSSAAKKGTIKITVGKS